MNKKIQSFKKIVSENKIHFSLLLLILIVGCFFRFYNAPYRYSLGDESIRDAAVAYIGANQIQFPLTGPFSSAGPFTFGPWYWNQLILFNMVVPVTFSPWILLGILSTITIFVYYKIGEALINKEFGLLIAFFVALSPSQILSSFGLTNPNLIHLYVALTFYFFIRSINEKLPNWMYLLFGISLGIGANIHYQMLILFILPILGLFFKKTNRLNFTSYTALGIAITFLPLFFFDANNHWFTLRNFIEYSLLNKKEISIPYRWLFYIRDFWPNFVTEVIGTSYIISIVTILFAGISTTYLLIRKKLPYTFFPLLIAFFIMFFYLRYYDREKFFGYLHFLHPLLFIFIASSIYLLLRDLKYKSILLTSVIIIISLFLFPKNISHLSADSFNMNAKSRVEFIQQKYDGDYALYKCERDDSEPYISIISSTMYLLEMKGELQNPRTKLLFLSPKCQKSNTAMLFLSVSTPDTNNVIAVSSISDKEINKNGYEKVSLLDKFNSSTRWWFEEKP